MKQLFASAIALMIANSAFAQDTYVYACKVNDDSTHHNDHLFAAKMDFAKQTITWQGHVYHNLKQTSEGCAKDCWIAGVLTGKNAALVRIDTATQGVATLTIASGGPGSDGMIQYDCDWVRN
jgi:hypothetical protein